MSDGTTILLIDGHDKDRQFYAKSLKAISPDYVILEAASAPGGLELYNSRSIDCVILELELPDIRLRCVGPTHPYRPASNHSRCGPDEAPLCVSLGDCQKKWCERSVAKDHDLR